MYKKNYEAQNVPTANIAVNKSRLKVYKKDGDMPTFYLQKGQEFQIELFNPTTDTILAKIELNGKQISQGGLVLNPGQRVFLDRYIDVAKKFLFDTYEVSNTQEVKEAIKNNGDFKVSFYRESQPFYGDYLTTTTLTYTSGTPIIGTLNNTGGYSNNVNGSLNLSSSPTAYYNANITPTSSSVTMDSLSLDSVSEPKSAPIRRLFAKKSKSIETGRVEKGSNSNQKLTTVNKNFDFYAFHTVEYKLLPISQKINTVGDIKVKVYCTNCGSKLSKGHKFCGHCGTKA